MPLLDSRPLTPGQRFLTRNKQEVSKKRPERQLTVKKHSKKGRNCYGRITSRRRGGGHKRNYRIIDFRRDKLDIPAKVQAIEYDPNRTANLALLAYADGENAISLHRVDSQLVTALLAPASVLSLRSDLVCHWPSFHRQLRSMPLNCILGVALKSLARLDRLPS